MKQLVILGAGTAGTMLANRLRDDLPSGWSMTVIDPDPEHLFQPDLIFLPFGMQVPERMVRRRAGTLRAGVDWLRSAVVAVEPARKAVILDDGAELYYDLLVIATGSHIRPGETAGMLGDHWHDSVFDYYTLEGATRLRDALAEFDGGRLAINIVEMPIKCPVAPLEFAFLADSYFTERGNRGDVEIVYVTPLDGAFTRPVASQVLGGMLQDKGIAVVSEFSTGEVDSDAGVIRSWDEREVDYDLLVTIPTHMGASFIGRSGLGDELDFIPTDNHTLAAEDHDDVFVVGDATDLPTSKAGSVAHFQVEILVENLQSAMRGGSLTAARYDGHANCFIESGFGKGLLIDFNYDIEPVPGVYPIPGLGPLTLLRESRRNHWGKLAFRWVYWNMLLPGRGVPVPNALSLAGKDTTTLSARELEKFAGT